MTLIKPSNQHKTTAKFLYWKGNPSPNKKKEMILRLIQKDSNKPTPRKISLQKKQNKTILQKAPFFKISGIIARYFEHQEIFTQKPIQTIVK